MEKLKPVYIAGESVKRCSHYINSLAFPPKSKHRIAV